MTTTAACRCSTARRMAWANSPGDSSAGSTCCTVTRPASTCCRRSIPRPARARQQRVEALVEDEQRRALAARGRRRHELGGERRLAGPGRADDQRAGAPLEAAAEQRVQLGDAAGELLHRRRRAVLAGDQPRKDLEPAAPDDVVVIAAAEADAAELEHDAAAAAPRRTPGTAAPAAPRRARCSAPAGRGRRWSGRRAAARCSCRPAKNCLSARICRR